MNRQNWNGKKILVLGAARQGLALARYLSSHGANIVLNDYKSPDLFSVDLQPLQDLGVEMVFGSHPVELLNGIDLLCLSGGIPLSLPIVQQAVHKGIPLSNDSQVFMEAVPCRTIGITGSAGKTTTTTLVGRMTEVGHPAKVWVGGNIGLPLITFVDQMQPEDLVVMELSSFQLDQMTISPDIAAVLNITPNHLDRHGTMQAYIEAKSQILLHQSANNVAVLNRDDPGAWSLAGSVVGSLVTFGFNRPEGEYRGTSFDQGWVWLSTGINEEQLMPREMIMLKGDHNVSNVLAACAIAHAAGITAEAMVNGVAGFSGVPHRLELVRILHGVAWYNDSIATAPERTMAALRSFQEPVVLLLGGRDKNLPWDELVSMTNQGIRHIALFGEAAQMIKSKLQAANGSSATYSVSISSTLQEAINAAQAAARPGDIVLLSPGCTSFDAFKDFEERGEKFRQWVNRLT